MCLTHKLKKGITGNKKKKKEKKRKRKKPMLVGKEQQMIHVSSWMH